MKIRVGNRSKHELPEYTTKGFAGIDLKANLENDIVLRPAQRIMVPKGLFMEIPTGYEGQI